MNPKASLFIGILCISLSPIFVELAGTSGLTSAFYRLFVAWLFLAPYCIAKGKLKIARRELLIALTGGLIFGLDIAVWNISILKTGATISTLIANITPLWVGLLSYILFKKRSGLLFWAGTCLAILGMIILVGYQNVIHLKFNAGVLLALFASLLYAIYIMITKGILQKIDTLTFMFYNMLAASMFLLVICLLQPDSLYHFSTNTWLCFLGMGIICQLSGWLTINHSIKLLESTKVSIALLSQTVLAGFLAIVILHEQLRMEEIIGSVIVLAGITVTFLKREKSNNIVN